MTYFFAANVADDLHGIVHNCNRSHAMEAWDLFERRPVPIDLTQIVIHVSIFVLYLNIWSR